MRLAPMFDYTCINLETGEEKIVSAANEEMAVMLAAGNGDHEMYYGEYTVSCGVWGCRLTWKQLSWTEVEA